MSDKIAYLLEYGLAEPGDETYTMLVYAVSEEEAKEKLRQHVGPRKDAAGTYHGVHKIKVRTIL